ncbi:MAG: putative toxin-antitoxin system toxin component, PIN family [Myxococcota bacterium]|jgi:hypothetical protein
MIRAVFDANVFVSAAISPGGTPGRLIQMMIEGDKFEVAITRQIEVEIRKVMQYPGVRKFVKGPISPEDWLDDLMVFSDVIEDIVGLKGVSVDPDDDKYLSACLSGKASYLVTGDDHLLRLTVYEGVRIVSPGAFLGIFSGGS